MTATWMLTCWYSSTTSGCNIPVCTMASKCLRGLVGTTQPSGPYTFITLGIICIPLQHEAAINSCNHFSLSYSKLCRLSCCCQNWNFNAVAANPYCVTNEVSNRGVHVIINRIGVVYLANERSNTRLICCKNSSGRGRVLAIIVDGKVCGIRSRKRKEVEIYGGINDRRRANRVKVIRPSNPESPRRVIDFKDSVIHVGDVDQRDIIAAV